MSNDQSVSSTDSSEEGNMNFPLDQEFDRNVRERLRKSKSHLVLDADISYYHTRFSFGEEFREDEEFTPTYSPTKIFY